MNRILVTGAGGPAGNNFVRSLKLPGLYDYPFYIVGTDINGWRINLSEADKKYLVPRCNFRGYVDTLNKIIEAEKIDFIHPQPDVEVIAIAHNRNLLHAQTFLPPTSAIINTQDKWQSARMWKSQGINVADSIYLMRDYQIDYYAIDKALKKFGDVWVRATRGAGAKASDRFSHSRGIINWLEYWRNKGVPDMMAQPYLGGRNVAWHSIWKDGELITSMARERLEYIYPSLAPSGITGTPVVQKTIHDDKVNELGYKAVKAISSHWDGIACVDMTGHEGEFYVTEINPGRMFTTSLFFSKLHDRLQLLNDPEYMNAFWGNYPLLTYILGMDMDIPKEIPKYNALPKNWYWIRHIDMGYELISRDRLKQRLESQTKFHKLERYKWLM